MAGGATTPEINEFFEVLFEQYSYEYIRKLFLHTTLIQQSWTHEETFQKIKNLFTYLGISKIKYIHSK